MLGLKLNHVSKRGHRCKIPASRRPLLTFLDFSIATYLTTGSFCLSVLPRDYLICRNAMCSRYPLTPKSFDAKDISGYRGIYHSLARGFLRWCIIKNNNTKIEIYRVCLANLVMIGCVLRKERMTWTTKENTVWIYIVIVIEKACRM